MAPVGQQQPFSTAVIVAARRLLRDGDLNRSMQHLDSEYREEDVADEVQIEDLLQRSEKKYQFSPAIALSSMATSSSRL